MAAECVIPTDSATQHYQPKLLANMQVITSIYLNCRPDLRDEWLTGNEVDDLGEGQVQHMF